MKLVCKRADFSSGLAVARQAVSPRSTLPILSNLLIEAQGPYLRVTGTDLDLWISCSVPCQIEEPGSLTVPAKLLTEMFAGLPDDEVAMHEENGRLIVRCRTSNYKILTIPAEEYPAMPRVEEERVLQLSQSQLKSMLRQTTFAASKEESRAMLTGALLETEERILNIVATDTHRLAWRRTELGAETGFEATVIIPAVALNAVERVLTEDSDKTVKVCVSDNQVEFSTESTVLVTRVLEGQFPSYQKVVPKQWERRLRMNGQEFLTAVRRVEVVAQAEADKAILRTEDGVLVITAESQEVGGAREEVAISLEGDDIEIAFNARYLSDMFGVIGAEEAVMELNGPLDPAIIKPADEEGFLYVLMPMQI